MKITKGGTHASLIIIEGDKSNPEHAETRIKFPTGEVSITRTTDNNYWVHINRLTDETGINYTNKFTKARLDLDNKHAGEEDKGDFNNPHLNHIAVLTEKEV